jgi:methyl-accepting chemotaxis protein
LKLKAKKAKFPKNIWANIKKKKTGGYVDIEYPDEPSLIKLKNNDEISGFITKDISSLLEDENLQDIIDDTGSLVENASVAVQNLNGIFLEVRTIISDNRNNIDLIIKNLADMSSNLKNMSVKLDDTLSNENINSSMENINTATENIKQITSQVDNTTIPIVNRILCETYSTSKNAKEITGGVKNTLKKKMGLSRLMFGKPISDDCY